MDSRDWPDATRPTTRDGRPVERLPGSILSAEQLLDGFSYAERQRLRYLRQLYERGKLTEFPRRPRD